MTIPASQLVNVIPNVLSAGGSALVMNGLMLDNSTRIPVGEVLAFPNDGVSVSNYFGPSSLEVEIADVYFNGFNTSTRKPAFILFTQYNPTGVAAYVRGGAVNTLTIPQLQGLSGSLTIVVDGYSYSSASIDLASATSYSAAAALIETELNDTLPAGATCTGAIAAGTGSVTGSIAGNVLYVTAVASGSLVPGALITGTGVTAGTRISSQLTGTTGGVGSYAVTIAQTVASTSISATYGVLTVASVASGTLSVGQTLSGSGVTADTRITALGTGEGLAGTYYVQTTQTASSTTITATGTALDVSYDSTSGAFVIASGVTGASSTAAFPTGTLAASIFMTEATGAVLSQGAEAATPSGFMDSITQITQNWGTFMTTFDPDDGSGSVQKQLFAAWANGANNRYCYVVVDNDITATESNDATTSLGNILKTSESSGTCVLYDPNDQHIDAFVCGSAASIDFEATNGRITFAFKGQDGLVAGVTDATSANNLIANGYNFYGAYATANQQFLLFQNGQVSGKFTWLDSYINQIWLNNALQLALMELLRNVNSVPYNQQGYALIAAACADPINAALNFGAIRTGVTLSNQQAALINNAAGTVVSNVLQLQGWYLQIIDATPQVRDARTSPGINLWYLDGGSVQNIQLNSVLVK